MDNKNNRLSEALIKLGITQKQMAHDLGTSQSAISAISKGARPMTEGFACRVESMYGVNSYWLLTGEGEMLKEGVSVEGDDADSDDPRDENMVPLLPASAFAGSIEGFAPDSISLKQCEMITTPTPGAEMAIPITGDSMEPDYPDGSIAYIRRINEAAFIPWGHTVVLDTENGAFIKRIYPDNEDMEYVWAKSINPDYPPMHIPRESIYRIFRVLATARIYTTM